MYFKWDLLCLFLMITVLRAEHKNDEAEVNDYNEEDNLWNSTPRDSSKLYFYEAFDNPNAFESMWTKSQAKKEGIDEDIAKYDGEWAIEPPIKDGIKGDKGLVLKTKAKHAAISALLNKPFHFNNNPLIVQYEVYFQEGQECGGAYIKLLTETQKLDDLKQFTDKSSYAIMFGPDKCGNDYKLHFIFKHKNPLNDSVEEKHCQKPKERLEETYDDKLPHLYTLLVNPDNSFEIKIDHKIVNSGSLLEDFAPPVNPPKEIEDATDKKPDDWDEREKIPDPSAVKPDDWDEDAPAQIVDESAVMPEGWLEHEKSHIPDPNAKKPTDWDSEIDGEWEAPLMENPACTDAPGCGPWEPPLINNPDFKGKWRAPYIDNPNYKGKWSPRKIPNPNYFEDKEPFKQLPAVYGIGFELWSMSKDILFDNIIITDSVVEADEWAKTTFNVKRDKITKNSESVIQKIAHFTTEYPIMWIVYILTLGIPVTCCLYLCTKSNGKISSKQEKEELNRAAEKKKTDQETEDTKDMQEKEEEDDEYAEKNSNPDSDEENEEPEENRNSEENNEAAEEEITGSKNSEGTRKRRPRKE